MGAGWEIVLVPPITIQGENAVDLSLAPKYPIYTSKMFRFCNSLRALFTPLFAPSRATLWMLAQVLLVRCIALGVAGLPAMIARAADTAFPSVYWQHQAGVLANTVAVQQTRDGYLWIGTYNGLFRYDGVEFTLFDNSRVPVWDDCTVTSLYEAADGTLWIGHSRGAVSTFKDGVFTRLEVRVGDWVRDIASDAVGDIWVLDSSGQLTRLRDQRTLQLEDRHTGGILKMVCGRDGRLWVACGGRLYELARGQLVSMPSPNAELIQGIGASSDGGLWVVASGRLRKRVADQWGEQLGALDIGSATLSSLIEMANGRLVLGTYDKGVLLVEPGAPLRQQLYGWNSGLPSDWVLAVCEDHEGGVWLGSGSSGLFKLQEKMVTMLVPPDGWQGRSVLTALPAHDGGFWVGTEGAGVYRMTNDGRWAEFGLGAGLRNRYVWALCEKPGGELWAGTWAGLDSTVGGGFAPAIGIGELVTATTALAQARQGGLWVGSALGLALYDQGRVQWAEPEGARKLVNIRAILEQPDGAIWVGCNGEGLGFVRDGKVRQYLRRDGLTSDYIHGLYLDGNGALWLGTRGGGLNRFKDGRFSCVSVEQGLASRSIFHIEDDGCGYLWMSSMDGLLRVSKRELNECADGRLPVVNCLSYGLNEGLLTLEPASAQSPSGCRTADGRLAFPMARGLAVVDPHAVRLNPQAPPVCIESLRSGERVFAPQAGAGAMIEVGPGARRVEIKYTGLSFMVPEKVRFRYKIDGLDSAWVDAGSERRAVYSFLPPGRYVFRVTAANNDGVWNPEGRSLAFVVLPYFWQTLWFRLLAVASVLLGVAVGVWVWARYRLLRRVALLEREQAVASERTRIANDMHDDIGSSLTRISMLVELARRDIQDRPRLDAGLTRIYETARTVTRAVDEIVWAVNPRHDTLESLVSYIEKCAQDLLGAAGVRCRMDLPSEFPSWSPSAEVRHNLFLAYKEALNNAVRHSGADIVNITLTMSDDSCQLAIVDNGRGLSPSGGGERPRQEGRLSTGNGLPGMRRRLERIGGHCEIGNASGGGCSVRLFVPLHAPPGTPRARSSHG